MLAAQAVQGPVTDLNESAILSAFTQLSQQPSLYLQLNGTVAYRDKTTPFTSSLSYNILTGANGNLTLQVDLETYSNGVQTRRILGDGNSLWVYNFSLHQYSATSYGGTAGLARPDTYGADLLDDLNWAATGPDGYMAKLLRQVYNPGSPNYTSWMPGVVSVQLTQGQQFYDPINPTVYYYPSAGNNIYLYNASPRRTILFAIAPGTTSNGGGTPASGLEAVFFNQSDIVAGRKRITSWNITAYPGYNIPSGTFVPYTGQEIKGWRPVVAPKPVSH